jgi:hypothetical protein
MTQGPGSSGPCLHPASYVANFVAFQFRDAQLMRSRDRGGHSPETRTALRGTASPKGRQVRTSSIFRLASASPLAESPENYTKPGKTVPLTGARSQGGMMASRRRRGGYGR